MTKETIIELEATLNDLSQDLSKITSKKMFGCHALWANGNVFALVWKHGRIGVKLPEVDSYEKLLKIKGSEPWKAGPMKMAHWVLVPESYHKKGSELAKWLSLSHKQCSVLEKKPAKGKESKGTKK